MAHQEQGVGRGEGRGRPRRGTGRGERGAENGARRGMARGSSQADKAGMGFEPEGVHCCCRAQVGRAMQTKGVIGLHALTGKRPCSVHNNLARNRELKKLYESGATEAKPFEGLMWRDVNMYRWIDRARRVVPACQIVFNFQKGTYAGFEERFYHALTPENEDIPIRLMECQEIGERPLVRNPNALFAIHCT